MNGVAIRVATDGDLPAMRELMRRSIDELQRAFLSADAVRASHAVMGLDTQLVTDGTYFVATIDGTLAGCGGWSRRATLYGGDHSHDQAARPANDDAGLTLMAAE